MRKYIVNNTKYYDSKMSEFSSYEEAKKGIVNVRMDILNGLYDNLLWAYAEDEDLDSETHDAAARNNLSNAVKIYVVECTPSGIVKRVYPSDDAGNPIINDNSSTKITIESRNEKCTIYLDDMDNTLYVNGGMVCRIAPFGYLEIPLELEICICPDGGILHRGWHFGVNQNIYLHTSDSKDFVNATQEMKNTVNGLFSGRIKIDGIKIAVGGTVQDICPIDPVAEEKRIGKKIYLA